MKTAAIISALALAGSTVAVPAPQVSVGKGFSVIAARSGSPIHLRALDAQGQAIYIGKKTETYCPLKPKSKCPPGKVTGFVFEDGSMGMDTEVPGGQQVYVEKNGAVGYTQAHSATMPPGATTKGWTLTPVKGQDYEELGHKGGLFACPTKDDDVYQIFAGVKGFDSKHCLGFDGIAAKTKSPAAWQYT